MATNYNNRDLDLIPDITFTFLCIILIFWEILDKENISDVRIIILTFQILYVAFNNVFEHFIDGFLAGWWFIGF
jgi:hypothetical protein